jgi:transcriptional regulator with PAS, ATPase and Fis domain
MNDLPPLLDYGPGDEIIGNEQMIDIEKEYNLKEKQKILSLMIELKGNKSQVAKAMGISRSNLYNKMKAYDLL